MRSLLLIVLFMAMGCQVSSKNGRMNSQVKDDEVDIEHRLSADRKKLDSLRQTIPEEVKVGNDEWAYLLELMGQVRLTPNEVRLKFNRLFRKKRQKYMKDKRAERKKFNDEERKRRQLFLKKLKSKRDQYKRQEHTSSEIKYFYKEQDKKRKDFFAQERDENRERNSLMREKSNQYEEYFKDKRRQFEQEYRAYYKKYYEQKKEERKRQQESKEVKKNLLKQEKKIKTSQRRFNPETEAILQEFMLIPSGRAIPLEAGQ